MKRILFITLTFILISLSSCKYCFKYYEEKAIIEDMLNETCPFCEWKVKSITDTIGYSITPITECMRFYTLKEDWGKYDSALNICHEQSFHWTENKGGVERRLLIAHCVDKGGSEKDFEFFNEIRGGKSVRYYWALDEVTNYLDVAYTYFWH